MGSFTAIFFSRVLPSFLPPEKWDVAHRYSRLRCSRFLLPPKRPIKPCVTKGSVLPAPPVTPAFCCCTEALISRAASLTRTSFLSGQSSGPALAGGVTDRAWGSLLAHQSLPPRAAEQLQQPRDGGKQWEVFGQVSQRSLFNEQSRALISLVRSPLPRARRCGSPARGSP